MAHTTFTNGVTLTDAAWFQDVDTVAYTLFGNGTSYTGVLTLAGTTQSTSTSTGQAIIAGGMGLAKNLWVGGTGNFAGAVTLQAALTYGGVTLSNAVTGTGNMVLSASPTFTGTITAATIGAFTLGGTIAGGGNQINNVIIGTSTPLAGTFTTATANAFVPNSSSVPTNGMYLPAANTLGWATNSAESMRLDSSGNIGIGVTPSAWDTVSGSQALQIGLGASLFGYRDTNAIIGTNTYYDGTNWRYLSTAAAAYFDVASGAFNWNVAASGTAGNAISWTTAMSLNSDGAWYLGTNGINTPSASRTGTAWGFGGGTNNYWINAVTSTGASTHWQFANGNGYVGSIQTNGSATSYNTSSDKTKKRDKGIATSISVLEQTEIHDFEWLIDNAPDRGVFAQDAVLVKPTAVSNWTGSEGDEHWGVDYSKYVPDLIVGWQNHEARLAAIEATLHIQP